MPRPVAIVTVDLALYCADDHGWLQQIVVPMIRGTIQTKSNGRLSVFAGEPEMEFMIKHCPTCGKKCVRYDLRQRKERGYD